MLTKLIIKNGIIIDGISNSETKANILISAGVIKEIADKDFSEQDATVIDASGKLVLPALVDMHCHLREPGFEHKETISTGTLSAVKGGFGSVCCMPNTLPVNDNATVTTFIIRKAFSEGLCKVYPIGAITKGQKGQELAEMGIMYEAGCKAFSDDGHPVTNSLLMRRALEYSKVFDVPVISHCEDISLVDGGVMNEGVVSEALGLKGMPAEAEQIMVARDIMLARLTGARLHIAHVSTEGSVKLIRQAKAEGINVTAETCPHYFTLADDSITNYNAYFKVNPPLRTHKDIEAIKEALADGTIDVIATDHAPHHKDEKRLEFDKAPFGISGFETALSLSYELVRQGVLSLSSLINKMALAPAKIMKLSAGTISVGASADITIFDPQVEYVVNPEEFASKGKNTPYAGMTLRGQVVMTIVSGNIRYSRG